MTTKRVRLELNNSGAWKLIARFDVSREDTTDAIMNAAETLLKAINDPACGRPCLATLRISTDEQIPDVLMRCDSENGWRDANTGWPA